MGITMKKKKIAVFSGGWGGEFLQETLAGIVQSAYRDRADVFAFVNYSIRGDHPSVNDGEINIYRLPDIREFDGVILFANTFNRQWEIDYLTTGIKQNNIPCVALEYPLEGIPCISTDNSYGMRELVEHMIDRHGCRDILYISGPRDHAEAMERLNAFKQVMLEKSVPYTDSNIVYGDWSKSKLSEFILGWLGTRGRYPDAIICANDIMAMGVCSILHERHVSIPDEVKVTGYDGIRLAQTMTPAIASVNHEWKTMGKKAMECLSTIMHGGTIEDNIVLNTRFLPNVSCGCTKDAIIPQEYNKSGKAIADNIMEPIDLDSHFRHFYQAIRKATELDEIQTGFSNLFEKEHIVEGDEFKLCMVPEFTKSKDDDKGLPIVGYPEQMDIVCCLADGKRVSPKPMALRDCIFEAAERHRSTGLYVYLPLYADGRSFGFAMLTGPLYAANENQHYMWQRHMINALEQIRSNMKVASLWEALRLQSVTDQLTGVYNRHGCEQNIYRDMIDCGRDDGESVLFIIDVDNMKVINDKYGHAVGDRCLKMVAQAMTDTIPAELAAARFGGDEFLIGGPMEDLDITPEEIMEAIDSRLTELAEAAALELPLKVSIGYAKCIARDITDIEKTIVKADESMYATKEIHHRK